MCIGEGSVSKWVPARDTPISGKLTNSQTPPLIEEGAQFEHM
jgi:hypothetical protein